MEAVKKSVPSLMPDRMGLAEDKRHDWVVDVPVTVSREEILEPSYWAHVAAQMQPLDHIEARWEDGSKIQYLIVAMCEKNYAVVKFDRELTLEQEAQAPSGAEKHRVEWKGPRLMWSVIRLSDSQIIHNGEKSRDLATAWMMEHEKSAR
jgi:hypothetical protein